MRQLVYYTTAARNRQALFTKKFIFFYNIIFKILFLQSLTFALRHDSVNTCNKFIILYPFPSLEVSMYQQQSPALKETNPHGSQAFPCAFYRLKLSGHGILVKHHWHEEVEIIYFPGGIFTLDINMETFDVSSECFYFINPGELHSIRARSKEVSMEYAVVFQPELLCSPLRYGSDSACPAIAKWASDFSKMYFCKPSCFSY